MPQDLIIGARTGGSSNLLRVNNASRRFSFRDVDGSWKEAANTDFAIFEKPDEVSRFLILELSANADYNPAATMNSQTDQANFIYYDGAAWSAFPASGIDPTALGTLVAFNFAAVAKNLGSQIFFRFWWSDGQITTEKKASIFPALSLTNSGASSAVEVEAATDSVAGIARAATQTEVDDGTAGFIFVTPATLNAKKFAASKVTGLAAVATSGDYNDLNNKYELPAASASARGGVKIGSNINLTNGGTISVASASSSAAGVVQLASAAEVTAGVNNFKAVTPAGLKFELDKKVNSADLAAVATSGDYNDLSNKYELPAATSTTIGGVKPGGNLTVTADGTLNFTGFGAQSSDGSSLSSEIKVLKAGSGTQFSYNSGVLTIGLDSSVTGGLTAVSHDSTLTGQGTSADPLKVNAVTSVAVEANASDDKIPTELAVRKAVDAQKVTKLVLQRGVSDKALYPKIAFSASADFSSASEFDFSSNDFARSSARVFNGTGWITFPADGLGTPFDNKEVVIDVATLLGDAMPQLPFYFKFCWVEANGTASDYKSSVFPAAPSFPPAADVVDEERLLPTGGARGNVLKIDSTGKATWTEGIDEARLVPTGGGAGKVLGFQDGADRGNSDNVRLLLQNALTDSATGNASPATVTTQGVTLTAESDLEFSGNDSHVTAVLPVAEIFAADKEWTIDFWFNPVANSAKWNYVLTETNGDWGSHSLGLTWNSTNQTLEQDSGGYVASTIKAPNWPNASTPCASNQWHFVAVEKQKTESGWSLNYYLNGSPWLQVAFTSDFAPFDSTTPFWFGGNTSDGGRWFKGKANKLRVTAGARYGGKAFAVPDRSVDYEAPSGLPVWIDQVIPEPVDESRLLPENPANGDIPCYSNEPPVGVNYNDANTVLLLQGSSDNTAAAPTAERLNGTVTGSFPVQEDGSILVNSSNNYLTIPLTDTKRVFDGEFTVDTYIKTTQYNTTSRIDANWFDLTGRNAIHISNYPSSSAGFYGIWPYNMTGTAFPKTAVNGEWQHLAIDVYLVEGVRKFTLYINGAALYTGTWEYTSSSTTVACRFFGQQINGTNTYLQNASVMSLRVSNVARYKGVSFDPPADGKYLNPPAGYWSKLNKSALVQSVNGQTPDSSGAVTIPAATVSAAGLMAAADKAAIAGLTTHGIYPNALAKSGAIDFNEVIDHGFYFIEGDTPHLNYPETYQRTGGTLQVIRNGNYLTQMFIPVGTNKAFFRACLNVLSDSSERTFSSWQRLLTETDQYSQKVVALADFDDYRTPGEYFFYTAAHLNSPDAPNNTAGWLVVEIVSGGEHVKQTYYALNTRKTYIRTYNNRNQAWLPWLQQLSVEDITESKARPGYFKLPGGTIVQWGNFVVTADPQAQEITLPVALSSVYVRQASGSNSSLKIGIYGGTNGKITCYVEGNTSGTVDWMVIGK